MSFQLFSTKNTLEETEQFTSLKVNQSLTWSDFEKFDLENELDAQIENLEMQDSGWRFSKSVTMFYFYKTDQLSGRSYVIIPLRNSSTWNIENKDNYCFLWSVLAYLHHCENSPPNRVSNYRNEFNE